MDRIETLPAFQVRERHDGGGRLGPGHGREAQRDEGRDVVEARRERRLEATRLRVPTDGEPRVGEEQCDGRHQNIE